MPTRRKDKAAGTKSAYLDEDPAAAADMVVGGDLPFDEGTGRAKPHDRRAVYQAAHQQRRR